MSTPSTNGKHKHGPKFYKRDPENDDMVFATCQGCVDTLHIPYKSAITRHANRTLYCKDCKRIKRLVAKIRKENSNAVSARGKVFGNLGIMTTYTKVEPVIENGIKKVNYGIYAATLCDCGNVTIRDDYAKIASGKKTMCDRCNSTLPITCVGKWQYIENTYSSPYARYRCMECNTERTFFTYIMKQAYYKENNIKIPRCPTCYYHAQLKSKHIVNQSELARTYGVSRQYVHLLRKQGYNFDEIISRLSKDVPEDQIRYPLQPKRNKRIQILKERFSKLKQKAQSL